MDNINKYYIHDRIIIEFNRSNNMIKYIDNFFNRSLISQECFLNKEAEIKNLQKENYYNNYNNYVSIIKLLLLLFI